MSDERLLPCPFCGGEAICIERASNYPYIYGVMCIDCHCRTSFGKDTDKVIKTWNTRKPMERIVKKLEQQKQQYKRRSEEAAHVLQRDHFFGKMCSYDHAIKIVKDGGVDETD